MVVMPEYIGMRVMHELNRKKDLKVTLMKRGAAFILNLKLVD